jgi:hypothetical protein
MKFADNLDLMVRYIRHISPSSEPCDLNEGTIEQRIDTPLHLSIADLYNL